MPVAGKLKKTAVTTLPFPLNTVYEFGRGKTFMLGIIVALIERLCSAERTQKTWEVHYRGHKIRVVNTWFHGAFLFVDGECAAVSDKRMALSNTKGLTAELTLDDDSNATIDVYFEALIAVKARITANGKRIGGDY